MTQHTVAHYELRIEGHLDEHWSAWFGGLTLIREDDGTTTLRGAVTDQAELHGLLARVRDLGTTLISVKIISASDRPGRTTIDHGSRHGPHHQGGVAQPSKSSAASTKVSGAVPNDGLDQKAEGGHDA